MAKVLLRGRISKTVRIRRRRVPLDHFDGEFVFQVRARGFGNSDVTFTVVEGSPCHLQHAAGIMRALKDAADNYYRTRITRPRGKAAVIRNPRRAR